MVWMPQTKTQAVVQEAKPNLNNSNNNDTYLRVAAANSNGDRDQMSTNAHARIA